MYVDLICTMILVLVPSDSCAIISGVYIQAKYKLHMLLRLSNLVECTRIGNDMFSPFQLPISGHK